MSHPAPSSPLSRRPRARRPHGRTLVEMIIALGVFATATLGIWECIRTVFYLSAKNTGLNLSHDALQQGVDRAAELLRGSLQIVDVATFDGTNFTHATETSGSNTTGNAVRFLRCLPVTLFLLPDDGKSTSTMLNPQSGRDYQNPTNFLAPGNRTVKASFDTTNASLTDTGFVADLANARLLPRFTYYSQETMTTGNCQGWPLPGMDISGVPSFTTSPTTITLAYGLPPSTCPIPSCSQAYLVIVSAVVVINRSADYAEMIYYPDAMNVSRKTSLTQAIAPSAKGNGPAAFVLPSNPGVLSDPSKRGSLQISLPVFAPYLGNAVVRNGGTAALNNIEVNIPVETRRRAQF